LAVLCIDYGYKLAQIPGDLTRPQINFLMAALANRIEKMSAARSIESGTTKLVFVEDEDVD
jgi:hypothetical protein